MQQAQRLSILSGVLLLASVTTVVLVVYLNHRYTPVGQVVDLEDFVYEGEGQIYRSDTLQVGFRYPAGWTVTSEARTITVQPTGQDAQRAFVIEVRDITSAAYKRQLQADEQNSVYRESSNVLGYDLATEWKVSKGTGLDETVLFIPTETESYILTYHDFDEVHQDILRTFQVTQ